MSDLPPPPPPAAAPGGHAAAPIPGAHASWIKRVLAYVIDYIPFAILLGLGYAFGRTDTVTTSGQSADGTFSYSTSSNVGIVFWIFWLLGVLYWLWNRVWKMGTSGSSLGMGVIGTKAVKEATGQPLGVGANLLRQILLFVDFWICYIGVLWPLWDSKRQCLISDKATGAVVLPTK